MKKYSSFLINFSLFLLGIFLLYLAFRNQDFSKIGEQLQKIDYRWGIIILIISVLNHIFRSLRWVLLIKPIHPEVSKINTFWALMFGYLVNLAIPRLGEVLRCWALTRTDCVPFAPLLGTMINERVVDVLSLGIVTVLVFVFQFDLIFPFFQTYFFPPLQNLWEQKKVFLFILLIISILMLLILWKLRQQILKITFLKPFIQFFRRIWQGTLSIRQMPHKAWFLFYTLMIWLTYHWMTYFWFFALPATSHLGLSAGMLLLAVASFSRLVPIQGGNMGAYHFLVIKGFLILGVAELYGATMAFVIHFTQIIYTLVVGGLATLIIMYKFNQTKSEKI